MKIDFLQEAKEMEAELVAIRRELHANPELGNQEFKTARLIQDFLEKAGIQVERLLDTAVVGTLVGGKPGKTVAFRSDMDALPVCEETGLPFSSREEGKMHACGHDIHMSALLGAAKLLAGHRDEVCGNIKFYFQPDEECWGGAQRMIAAGCMENPHVDAVFGAHVDPNLPVGKVAVKYGNFYATSDIFTAVIHGVASHGSEPHNGIDPVVVGAQMIMALQTIPSRRMPPAEPCVLTVGEFHCGNRFNIISDSAKIVGQYRVFGKKNRDRINALVPEVIRGVAAANGATVDVDLVYGYSGIVNDEGMTDVAAQAARCAMGEESVVVYREPTMLTEDFGYFMEQVPGAFYHIGVKSPEAETVHPLHSGKFVPDEAAITNAAAMHAQVAFTYLQER